MNPTRSTVLAVAILFAAGGAAAGVAHAQPEPSPSPTPSASEAHDPSEAAPGPAPAAGEESAEAAAPAAPKNSIEADGTYKVGVDIVPGTYSTPGPITDGVCYWKRTSGGELVDNALTKKPQIVQVKADDTTFTTNDCQTWQLTNAAPPPQPGPQDLLGQLGSFIGSGILNGAPPS